MELQKTAPAYMPSHLIQHIPHLIHFMKGEEADAHEFLIAVINKMSKTTKTLFQSWMTSEVKCSTCGGTITRSDTMQDISLQIKKAMNLTVEDSLQDFFKPETLESDNTYQCEKCDKKVSATEPLSVTQALTILMIHLERLILGQQILTHTAVDTNLDLGPHMTQGHAKPQTTQLVGLISHHGPLNGSGHYTAVTKKEETWTLFDDNSATTIFTRRVLQAQAYNNDDCFYYQTGRNNVVIALELSRLLY